MPPEPSIASRPSEDDVLSDAVSEAPGDSAGQAPRSAAATSAVDVAALLDRVPTGWTPVIMAGRRYGLRRTDRAGGRAVSIFAEELGGTDVISANVYRASSGDLLRPCEMPAAAVVDFLQAWQPASELPD